MAATVAKHNPDCRALTVFLHAQVACFWLVTVLMGALLRHYGMLETFRRCIFAFYPLVQAIVVGIVLRQSRSASQARVMACTLYGTILLLLFNPESLGWFFHLLIAQTYYSLSAFFLAKAQR